MKITRRQLRKIVRSVTQLSVLLENQDQMDRFIDKLEKSDVDTKRNKSKVIKGFFADNADRQFLNSLRTIHWVGNLQDFLNLFQISNKNELSCLAYLPSDIITLSKWGHIGIEVKGWITILANNMDVLSTGHGSYAPENKMSGYSKVPELYDVELYKDKEYHFVFQEEDWSPKIHFARGLMNEALVDNWKIERVYIPKSEFKKDMTYFAYTQQVELMNIKRYCDQYNIELIEL